MMLVICVLLLMLFCSCLRSAASASGRPVKYIALPPLLGSVVFADMQQYQNPEVARFVSHMGGHPRSFEWLRAALKQRRDKPTYDDLFGEYKKSVSAAENASINIPAKLIANCLLQNTVNFFDPAGAIDSKPISYYIDQVWAATTSVQ